MTSLKMSLGSLSEKSASITTTHEQSHSAVNCLPPEIIDHIFWFCIDEPTWYPRHKSQLYISWVCRLWRRIIINNPSFWTTIDFSDNPQLVKIVIQRSRTRRLRIELCDFAFDGNKNVSLLKSTLKSEASRIEYMEATVVSSNIQFIVKNSDALCRPFPSLRHLAFCGGEDDDDEIPLVNSKIPFTLDISKLEIFEIDDSSRVPWRCLQDVVSKVRKLRIGFERPDTCINFFDNLQSFGCLEVLSMHFGLYSRPRVPTISITLPNITALLITGHPNTPIPSLATLRVPNLQRLGVCEYKGYSFTFHPDFDYASIQYITISLPAGHLFNITGSETDAPNFDWQEQGELFLHDSSPMKRFQLQSIFDDESAGYHSVLGVLNDLLPKMPRIRKICLPSLSPKAQLPHIVPTDYPWMACFSFVCDTSDIIVFARQPDQSCKRLVDW